jgi:uncharacterized membrane protein YhiD involved in acid resistance
VEVQVLSSAPRTTAPSSEGASSFPASMHIGIRTDRAGHGRGMDTGAAIAIVVVVLVVLVVLALVARARGRKRDEQHRAEAAEHRDLARVAQVEADRKAAEADERAARARKEQLAAETQRLEAERAAAEAVDLRDHADTIDPDVESERR